MKAEEGLPTSHFQLLTSDLLRVARRDMSAQLLSMETLIVLLFQKPTGVVRPLMMPISVLDAT